MHQQGRRTASADCCGFLQPRDACCSGKAFADQKVAVAGDEVDRRTLIGQLTQQFADLRIERVGQIVVTDPVLEQVAEDEQRLDSRGSGIGEKGPEARGQIGALRPQVQVGYETGSSGDGQHGAALIVQTISARSMMTSSVGTFWWKPLLPVFTDLILSTTSWPSTTRPKTQ